MDLEKEVISYSYIKEKQELIINYKDGTLNKIENPSKQDVVKVILILLKKRYFNAKYSSFQKLANKRNSESYMFQAVRNKAIFFAVFQFICQRGQK